jgi:methyltransferase family protein
LPQLAKNQISISNEQSFRSLQRTIIRANAEELLRRINMNELQWFLDEMFYFRGRLFLRGWAYHPSSPVREVGISIPAMEYIALQGCERESPDVEAVYGDKARNCRFEANIEVGQYPPRLEELRLVFVLADNTHVEIERPVHRRLHADPYYVLQERFFDMLRDRKHGSILELGSRDRRHDVDPFPLLQASHVRKHRIPQTMRYVGTDIVEAPNVNVVGDAHRLSSLFQKNEFDAMYAAYVFEHLLMPWKVVLEMNKIMKITGIVMVLTHHTWPLHEQPWDFWRYSDNAWHALFNRFTGFRVVATAMGEPSSIVGHLLHATTLGLDTQPAPLFSGVIAEKTGKSKVRWDAEPQEVLTTHYPR